MSGTRNIRTYITDIESDEHYRSAITVEHRSNNPKRDYLFVNRLQCKHIPSSPRKMVNMCKHLADKCIGIKPEDKVMVIGFAETATAIGRFVAESLDNCVFAISTTREDIEGSVEMITFEEEHSHATTQKLLTYSESTAKDILNQITYVLFVEDEISTGNTIMNFIKAFKAKYDYNFRFGVASICNWQNEENIKLFTENNIDRYYIVSGKLKDVNAKMILSDDLHIKEVDDTVAENQYNIDSIHKYPETEIFRMSRLGYNNQNYYEHIIDDMKNDILYRQLNETTGNHIRVIGSEECMAFAIELGLKLEMHNNFVVSHSTTRSCIDVMCGEGRKDIGINDRHRVVSAYENDRKTYIYNTNCSAEEIYDLVVIISDTEDDKQFTKFAESVASLFDKKHNRRIVAYKI